MWYIGEGSGEERRGREKGVWGGEKERRGVGKKEMGWCGVERREWEGRGGGKKGESGEEREERVGREYGCEKREGMGKRRNGEKRMGLK